MAKLNLPGGTVEIEGEQQFVNDVLSRVITMEHRAAVPTPTEQHLMKEGLQHAWNWFSLHAEQRMKSLNYFFLAVSLLVAAYVTALKYVHPAVAAGIGIVGVLTAICFSSFELRIKELINAGEDAMKASETCLAKYTGNPLFNITQRVEVPKRRITAYSVVIPSIHLLMAAAFLGGAMYAYSITAHLASASTQVIRQYSIAGGIASIVISYGIFSLLMRDSIERPSLFRKCSRIVGLVSFVLLVAWGLFAIISGGATYPFK